MHSPKETVADRIKRLRTAQGMKPAAFARHLDNILLSRLLNVENYGKPLGIELAQIIVRKCPGITLDWLYFGKIVGLTVQMFLLLYDTDLAARLTNQPKRD
jgi:hypothetical protein